MSGKSTGVNMGFPAWRACDKCEKVVERATMTRGFNYEPEPVAIGNPAQFFCVACAPTIRYLPWGLNRIHGVKT